MTSYYTLKFKIFTIAYITHVLTPTYLSDLEPSFLFFLTTYQTSGLFSVPHLNQCWYSLFPLPEIIILFLFPQPGHSHHFGVCLSDRSSERLS